MVKNLNSRKSSQLYQLPEFYFVENLIDALGEVHSHAVADISQVLKSTLFSLGADFAFPGAK